MADDKNTVKMEGVTILFRNFEGREEKYNNKGDRGFSVILDEDTAQAMEADGWNVKRLKPREDAEDPDELPVAILPVAVSYKNRPPKIAMLTESNRTFLGEDQVEMLDWADIQNVDLIVTPYSWDVNGKQGIKAYLKTMFVTIEEDELEKKYAKGQTPNDDVPFG